MLCGVVSYLQTLFGKGLFKVKVQAVNALSAFDVDVDLEKILEACQNYSNFSTDEHEDTVRRILFGIKYGNNNLCSY